MNTTALLDRLEGVRRSGQGWAARCPAHEDKNASLSVSEGRDGEVLVKCHAGCEVGEVVGALGLKTADLFADRPQPHAPPRPKPVAFYDYMDAEGLLLYQVVR